MKKTETVKTPEGWAPMVAHSQLPELVPFNLEHIDTLVERKQFPAPLFIGPKKRAWLASELVEWQQNLIKARDTA